MELFQNHSLKMTIYKKNIAEGVFNGESKFFAIQSKITEESLQTHKLNGKIIQTGNLVFSYFKKKII